MNTVLEIVVEQRVKIHANDEMDIVVEQPLIVWVDEDFD